MRHVWVVTLLLVGALTSAAPTAAQVRVEKPNLVGGELLGRGVILTLNYERFLTNNVGIGGGFMAVGSSGDFVGVIPLYASLVLGDVHGFYMSGGATSFFGEGVIDDDFESETVGSIAFGYQFQSYGGFFVRPLFTVLFGNGDYVVWPGITIGGSF